ncbi:MAG: NADH-quinone oxidoreductase subunit NuoB [Spirochaetes bacterium]|nr:NADH-quinone oxidoreductase subunit NuoB [Spirochaetota bacterium]
MGLIQKLPAVVDPLPGGRHLVDAVDTIVNWARANSLWPLTFGTSCCAIEMMASSMPRYDISRFGSEVFRATPRQADLIILAGTIVDKMVEVLKTLYEQLPGPKYVIAMGSCTISGGPFIYDNYSVVKGADRIIPVDVYIPGCPPRPEALFHGLLLLQEKIKKESLRRPWVDTTLHTAPFVNPFTRAALEWETQEKEREPAAAEARAKFAAENPDFKPFKAERVLPPPMPDLPRPAGKGAGLPHGELFDLVRAAFPSVVLHKNEGADRASVDALPSDAPLDFVVPPGEYLAFARFLRDEPRLALDLFFDLTAVDWEQPPAPNGATTPLAHRFHLVVQLLSTVHGHLVFFRVPLAENEVPDDSRKTAVLAEVPSLVPLWPGANFKEREAYDMFGIRFSGHPDLRRLLNPETFEGFPLRKDFTHPAMVKRPY